MKKFEGIPLTEKFRNSISAIVEDDGYETILSNGYVKGNGVYGEFLFRRKK
ncbi:unknown [Firmicutes bacterium CAG:631]|nr:unknown [Firmicutes bacterium CAG:631]